jgi:hypothetical protein
MTGRAASRTVFATYVDHPDNLQKASLLAESIRTFGGSLSDSYIWVFCNAGSIGSFDDLKGNGTKVIPLELPRKIAEYPFAGKVAACARAEEMTESLYRSLVWIAPDCLVLKPPLLFELDGEVDAALRPVHIRNVGSPADSPPDGYWKEIFRAAGISDLHTTIESFVDCRKIRAYFNTHAFAVNPSCGLMRKWLIMFTDLVNNGKFQKKFCEDTPHRVFLHQATLSTILASELSSNRILMLPEEYCYPYNLHERVPKDRKARTLNELVCIAYENRQLNPDAMSDIIVEEPLLTWLS